MAKNFSISQKQKTAVATLRLKGIFDGMSACDLICAIKNNKNADKITINTNGLSEIISFGKQVLWRIINQEMSPKLRSKLEFTGENIIYKKRK